jgi:hypothetical protein
MNTKAPQVGHVTKVDTSGGFVKVDVMLPRPGQVREGLTFLQLAPGVVTTPKETQQVLVQPLADGSEVAMFPLNGVPFLPADVGEGEICFSFDEGTHIRVKPNGGSYDVSIEASGDVNVQAEGAVNIDAAGDVLLGGQGAVSVAVQEHTHDYSWTDSGGSGTTSTPNEGGTETLVK